MSRLRPVADRPVASGVKPVSFFCCASQLSRLRPVADRPVANEVKPVSRAYDNSRQARSRKRRPERKIGGESSLTRTALLDAAEKLMRKEGYAAVTSRKLASVAKLTPQLVHYYFRTMDELYLALGSGSSARTWSATHRRSHQRSRCAPCGTCSASRPISCSKWSSWHWPIIAKRSAHDWLETAMSSARCKSSCVASKEGLQAGRGCILRRGHDRAAYEHLEKRRARTGSRNVGGSRRHTAVRRRMAPAPRAATANDESEAAAIDLSPQRRLASLTLATGLSATGRGRDNWLAQQKNVETGFTSLATGLAATGRAATTG